MPSNTSHFDTEHKDYNFNWDSGFRIGLGYGFPCDTWGLALVWTHYRTDAFFSDSGFSSVGELGSAEIIDGIQMPVPNFISGLLTAGLISFQNGFLETKWDFQFNQVDLDFFRNFYVGRALSLKPYVGLRALYLKNRINSHADYEGKYPAVATVFFPATSIVIDQCLVSDFKSFGLKGGLETYWEVMCGLGIYGNVGLSLLYAHYETNQKLDYIPNDTTNPTSGKQIINARTPYNYNCLKLVTV